MTDWTPPKTSLPKEFVDATAFLIRHGMADPRGGRFVETTVVESSSWTGGGEPVKQYGWLVAKDRLAAIDGLVYKPLSTPKNADFASWRAAPPPSGPFTSSPYGNTRPMVAAMLLVHGDVAEAERVGIGTQNDGTKPFMNLANAYLVARFHRATAAHMRGDDQLAYDDAEALRKDRAAFEKQATTVLGAEWLRQTARPDMGGDGTPTAFRYLKPIDSLAKDSLRRLRETSRAPLDIAKLKDKPQQERIEVLIANLDNVKARQWAQPGGVNLVEDPIMSALIAEGSPAMEPLLDTLEKDDRLTRSVGFGRDFFPDRTLLSVKDAAYAAFRSIAQIDLVVDYGQKPTVAQLRQFWNENRGLSPEERWMHTLADDTAGARRWLESASRLIEPSNVQHYGEWLATPSPQPGELKPAMKGEKLRNRQNPSLSDLLSKRALQVAQVGAETRDTHGFELGYGLQLAIDLAKWDPDRALPTLQATCRRTMDLAVQNSSTVDLASRPLVEAIDLRYRSGDKAVLGEYAAWIVTTPDAATGQNDCFVLKPLVQYANEPSIREAARQLFLGQDSAWNIAKMAKSRPGWNHAESMVMTPILALEPVREGVRQVLADKTEIGESWTQSGTMYVKTGSSTSGMGGQADDPLAPSAGTKRPYRICDSMATALTRLKGAPAFKPYWPTEQKDAAIAKLMAFVDGHVADMSDVLGWPHNWETSAFK